MADRWRDDPNLMDTAIDAVVRRALKTPMVLLPDAFVYALMFNPPQPDNPHRTPYAIFASVCRERLAMTARGKVK